MVKKQTTILEKEKREEIGKRIMEVVKKREMSLNQYAEFLSDSVNTISSSTLSRVCNGGQLPSKKLLDLLVTKERYVDYDYIIFGEVRPVEKIPLQKLCKIFSANENDIEDFLNSCKQECNKCIKCFDENDDVSGFKYYRKIFDLDINNLSEQLNKSVKTLYKHFSVDLPIYLIIGICEIKNISANYLKYENFDGIPSELDGLLFGYKYLDQLDLLRRFAEIANEYNLL